MSEGLYCPLKLLATATPGSTIPSLNRSSKYCEGNKKTEKAHKAFCAHLKRYCIRKCPLKNGFGSGGKKGAKIVMKVDREWDDIRIEQLEEVVFNVARF